MSEPQTMAIVALGSGALGTAGKIRANYPAATIYGLRGRVDVNDGAQMFYDDFGTALRELYRADVAIVALCAAGIVIRSLAPVLGNPSLGDKQSEPPVLAVAEDGSAVVPLLGGLGGVNKLAREIAALLNVSAAITTSGELRFGTCLLNPPAGYALADIGRGKRFVADLLHGGGVRIEGDAPWLRDADLPLDAAAQHTIRITTAPDDAADKQLLIHPRTAIAALNAIGADIEADIRAALDAAHVAPQSLACVLAPIAAMGNEKLSAAADSLNAPLRFAAGDVARLFGSNDAAAESSAAQRRAVSLSLAEQPVDPDSIGIARGALTVIGLGPGAAQFMVPAARRALHDAQDILGYVTYVEMAGPFRADQNLHCTDNREEMQRARHAFELAAAGRRAVVVSSGDPGVFAMATAVLETLHGSDDPLWHAIDLQIYPGVSAALATAARAGAPLGHDFCAMSLSDNLKPWDIIERRIDHAAAADFALAFYNPISKARPWQLQRALDIVARHRDADTVVVLGRDIGRPAESLTTTTLAQLRPEQVDMRTLVIIGSSQTRRFARSGNAAEWVYTPRWYRQEQPQ